MTKYDFSKVVTLGLEVNAALLFLELFTPTATPVAMKMKRIVVPMMNTGLSLPLRPVAAFCAAPIASGPTSSSIGRAISTSTGLCGDSPNGVADMDDDGNDGGGGELKLIE